MMPDTNNYCVCSIIQQTIAAMKQYTSVPVESSELHNPLQRKQPCAVQRTKDKWYCPEKAASWKVVTKLNQCLSSYKPYNHNTYQFVVAELMYNTSRRVAADSAGTTTMNNRKTGNYSSYSVIKSSYRYY